MNTCTYCKGPIPTEYPRTKGRPLTFCSDTCRTARTRQRQNARRDRLAAVTAPLPTRPHEGRSIRVAIPDDIYRTIRHRLADIEPEVSISSFIVGLIQKGVKA